MKPAKSSFQKGAYHLVVVGSMGHDDVNLSVVLSLVAIVPRGHERKFWGHGGLI